MQRVHAVQCISSSINNIWQRFGSSLSKCDASLFVYSAHKKQSKGIWSARQHRKMICKQWIVVKHEVKHNSANSSHCFTNIKPFSSCCLLLYFLKTSLINPLHYWTWSVLQLILSLSMLAWFTFAYTSGYISNWWVYTH